MKFHDELNPKLWHNFELKEEVKDKLEEITEAFIEYLDIPAESILDVQITGSSANYNYTEHSDLDLHLIVDYEKVHQECPIVEGYLWSMKAAFNKEHDISIYGVPVEVYAEDSRQSAVSNGVYSLLNDEWIKKPEKIEPTTNDAAVLAKYNEIKDIVDKLNDSEEAQDILDKVYEMRKAGLAEAGEFSTENLAFKMLRNEGYIDMLKKIKKEKIDKQLTLESYNKSVISTKLKKQLENKIKQFFKNDEDALDWAIVDITEHHNEIKVEVRVELDYNGMLNLSDILNPIVSKYDRYAYFDFEQPGIMVATIERKNDARSKISNESIKEDYEEDDYEDIEEMHKERYVTYFETPEGRQKYTIYYVYTDSTDNSYNELCDTRDNQLGMYSSYKELKDALKERAEKIAKQQGWTVKSIENLGEDDEYYKERNKWESIKEDAQKLNIEDFKIEKTDSGLYKVAYDSRIGYIKPDKSYSKVRRALGDAIYKYNTKDIQANRKALMSKLHKLFKQAGIPKMQDMKSSVRGYRPITQNGYYIDTYPGDKTSFDIGLSKFNDEYLVKIKQILDSQGIKYWEGSDHFSVDMEKQDIKNESIKEDKQSSSKNCNETLQAGEAEILEWLKQRQVKVGQGFNKLSKEATAYYMAKLINSLDENIISKIKEADFSNFNTKEFTLENKEALEAPKVVPCNSIITHLVCLYINPETNKTYNEKPTEEETLRRSIKIKMNKLYNNKTGWDRKGYYFLQKNSNKYEVVTNLGKKQYEVVISADSLQELNDILAQKLNEKLNNRKNESVERGFKKGDKVQLRRKNNRIGIVRSIFIGDKDKNDKDIKYLDVQFEDGRIEGRPASDFRKVNESINDRRYKSMNASEGELVNESNKKYRSVVADDKYTRLTDLYGRRGRKRTLHVKATGGTKQFLSGPKKEYRDIKTGELFYLADNSDVMTDIMGEPYTKFEIIDESFDNKPSHRKEYKIRVILSNGKERYYKANDYQHATRKFSDLCIRFNNCELLEDGKVLHKQSESVNRVTFDNREVIRESKSINQLNEEIEELLKD